jgi:ankyrin repeat protein
MLACRLKDTKIVHLLMKNGAIATQKGLNGMTALHICVIHNYDEGIKVIVEYLKEGAGDAMRVIRFIESQDQNGDSALLYACRIRNGFMCSLLTSLGANPNNRNAIGRTAPYIARDHHWNEIADWLEKKASTSIKVETYSDQQFEKNTKLGHMRLRELIESFGKTYLLLIQHRLGVYPLGCPFKIASFILEKGENAFYEQQLFVDNHQKFIMNRLPLSYMIESQHFSSTQLTLKRKLTILQSKEIDSETALSYLTSLKEMMNEMVTIIRQGYTYPDYETLSQPLAWTPLMCAIALNDIRSAKLLLKEGANPNYPNRDGMTAMMLVSQLQGVEMFIELLQYNGDLSIVDNQGYSVLAYASSLPLPTIMNREIKDIFTNNDIYGPKLLATQQIIEHILANYSLPVGGGGGGGGSGGGKKVNYDSEELREMVRKNYLEVDNKKIDNYLKQNKLLELYGLTPIDNEHNLLHQVQSSQWRVKEGYSEKDEEEEEDKGEGDGEEGDKGKKGKKSSFYSRQKQRKEEANEAEKENEEDSLLQEIEEQMKKKYQQQEEDAIKAEQKAKESDVLRCPICTLEVPCAHFLKIQSLISFLNEKEGLNASGGRKLIKQGSAISKDLIAYRKQFGKKLKIKNRSQEILEEAQIGDRQTDRSKTFAIGYQERERSLEKSFQQRVEEENEEEELQQLEEEERKEIAMEELLEYPPSEYYYGSRVLKSSSPLPPVEMFPALPSSSPSSSPNKPTSLSRPPSFEGSVYDSLANSKPSTADGLISSRGILKPQSRGDDSGGGIEEGNIESPKKSRRVKFNLPGDSSIKEENERLAITDGSEYLQEPGQQLQQHQQQQLVEYKSQQLITVENALHVLQTGGEDDFQLVSINEKKPSNTAVSDQKKRLILFTKDSLGKTSDGFTTIDETSYYRLPPKPTFLIKKQKTSSSSPSSRPLASSSSGSPTDTMSYSPLSAMEFVKEIMTKQQSLRKPGKKEERKKKRIKNILPVKLKTSISGWIFVHSAKITSNIIPLESISVSQV